MGRLIDADELEEKLRKHQRGIMALAIALSLVDEAPTAYDVEDVVKRIKEFAECDTECREFYGCRDCAYKEIIEIIRNGGVSNVGL